MKFAIREEWKNVMKALISILAAQPFVQGMTSRHIELLAENSMRAEFKTGEPILIAGGPANRFYLILKGRVELESPGANCEAVRIQTLGAGDVVGWSWLFPPYYWHFNAWAPVPTSAIFLYGTRLRELCDENHDFGYELMKRVSEIVIKRLYSARRELVNLHNNLLPPV